MPDTIPPFEWTHVEQHHYECRWHGFRLVANQDLWKVEWNGFTRQGTPRTLPGIRVSAARRAEVARANAEAAAYRQFMKEAQGNEQ